MRLLASIAALAILLLLPAAARADSTWDHNGSTMLMREDGPSITITYEEPRSGIRKHGVRRGSVLFEGGMAGGGRLVGTAYVFREGCEPADYAVEGAYRPGSGQARLMLRGNAPVRVSGGCRVTGYSASSGNARLVFTLIGSDGHSGGEDVEGEGEPAAEPDAPAPAPGRITCPAGKAWNGSRCVKVSDPSLIDENGQPLDGYYMDENGNIFQDNGGE